MQKKRIAIIGNGNLGTANLNGFINNHKDYGLDNVFLLGRDYFDSDPRGTSLSELDQPLSSFDTIILTVKPTQSIDTLLLLRGKIGPNTVIISFVSGLSMHLISIILNVPNHMIVTGTTTTNIAYGKGILVFNNPAHYICSGVRELFSPLCKKIIETPGRKIIQAVNWVGSGNGMFQKHILLKAQKSDRPFREFIDNLNMEDVDIQSFIRMYDEACNKIFNADCFIREGYEATLETVKISCHSIEDIETEIKKVATPNGCTEQGIGELSSLEIITVGLLTMIINKIHRTAITFPRKIRVKFNSLTGIVPFDNNPRKKRFSTEPWGSCD